MNPNKLVFITGAFILALVIGSLTRSNKKQPERHVILYLNDLGQITRVDNNSGMSLDLSGVRIIRR
jgi:hypothetical protein